MHKITSVCIEDEMTNKISIINSTTCKKWIASLFLFGYKSYKTPLKTPMYVSNFKNSVCYDV